MPIPFMRAVRLGAFLIPLLSIAASATLQPALLSLASRRSMTRAPVAEALRRSFPVRVEMLAGTAVAVAGATGYRSLWPLVLALPLGFVLALTLWAAHVPSPWTPRLPMLSVGAAYGLLVIAFSWGGGHALLGSIYEQSLIEGWIPVILFAMLFGLSMDYEVFLVTRMREAWDSGADDEQAVREGLEKTGRIVTAAAVIMVAAFSGFVAGRMATMQEFGFGLAAAILFDATLIRAVLVPSLMALFGRYNWWLPAPLARLVRVEPSPLAPLETPVAAE